MKDAELVSLRGIVPYSSSNKEPFYVRMLFKEGAIMLTLEDAERLAPLIKQARKTLEENRDL